ncbi:MAG: hypothetical protein KY393_07790 [Actinobacteria bacterium]|nr:hypothetical protein [Actinomycetota bacterium]
MEDDPEVTDRFDSVADFYGKNVSKQSDPLVHALKTWDEDEYLPLQDHDPELYGLICSQVGLEIGIFLGDGCVQLKHGDHQVVLTWNGDDEDLLDLVLEGSAIICGEQP